MLDVHPPHHPTHSWKDFFVHIATICVGLLIAIGLEQAVEHLHRAREAHELRESLARETDKIIRDSKQADASLKIALDWETAALRQISDAGLANKPLGNLPAAKTGFYLIAADPVYRAARANGQLALLTREEVQVYAEVDTLIEDAEKAHQELIRENKALNDLIDSERFGQPAGGDPFARASREDLHQFYDLLAASHDEHLRYRARLRYVWAAATEIAKGERDLDEIEAGEHQFDKVP